MTEKFVARYPQPIDPNDMKTLEKLCGDITIEIREPCKMSNEIFHSGVLIYGELFIPLVYKEKFDSRLECRILRKRFFTQEEALQYSHDVVDRYKRMEQL